MFSWQNPGRDVCIVAHRGSSSAAPENTLAAFRRALADGADAVELDVRLTADDELVVIHDARLGRTTSGRGRVAALTLAELRRLDAGSWFNGRHQSIPTLEEVLDAVPTSVGVNVELKAERVDRKARILAERCCRLVSRSGRGESVLVTSFTYPLVALVKKHHPSIPAGILLHPLRQSARSPVRAALSMGADYIVFGRRTLTRRLTENAHEMGIRVAEYTVNTEYRLRRAKRYGVDAVITNLPAMMKRRYGVV